MTNIGRLLFITLALFAAQVQVMAAAIVVEGDCTLPAAIASANGDRAVGGCDTGDGADTISLSEPITLTAPLPPIKSEITIAGGGNTISGNGAHRIFLVEEAGSLTIQDLTMVDGSVSSRGGAIYNLGKLNVYDSAFRDSQARRFGGAIANWGEATVKDSSFNANASRYGGAIYNSSGATLIVEGGSFRSNAARTDEELTGIESNPATNLYGGAIYNQGDATITNSNFASNSADNDGGALWNIGKATVNDTYFSDNSAANDGGAIANISVLVIIESAFSHNRAGGNFGGAIANWGDATIKDSDFTSNKLAAAAGAAIANLGDATIEDSRFIANETERQGGAIFTVGETQISGSTFRDNTSAHGGAIINQEGGRAKITDSEFTGNVTTEEGGAIYSAADGDVNLVDSWFSDNKATEGGALYSDGAVDITRGGFRDNSATASGGAVASGSELNISDSVFRDNRSLAEQGGGIRHFGNRLTRQGEIKYANNDGGNCVGPACAGYDIVVTATCTLADAIGAANNDSPYGGCPAGDGADRIGLLHDVTLEAALPKIVSEITIEGADDGKTIDGDDKFRIFHVSKGGSLTISQLTLVNGSAAREEEGNGGAILNEGKLTAEDSFFRSHFAFYGGAISNEDGSSAVIRNSDFESNEASGDGGAIYNEVGSSAVIHNSDFESNTARSDGGAIFNFGIATISGAKINQNTAAEDGGGIHNTGKATISNSKIDDNTSAENGGGIYNTGADASIQVKNSIISNNSAAEGAGIWNRNEGSLVLSVDNIVSGNTGGDCVGAGCIPIEILVNDVCSLADAIAAANTDSAVGGCEAGKDDDVIGLSEDVTLDAELPPINSVITIQGDRKTIDGAGRWRIFQVGPDGNLIVHLLTMKNGSALDATPNPYGGAILNYGSLTVNESDFVDNKAVFGGAIKNQSGATSVISDSDFENNSANADSGGRGGGGAIHNEFDGASVTVTNSVFSGNTSDVDGGALHNEGIASVSDSKFENNSATNFGGAIRNERGTAQLSVNKGVFENNSAAEGGAIYNEDNGASVTVAESEFSGNTSSTLGGALYNRGVASVSDSQFRENSTSNFGGAIHNAGATSQLTVSDSVFESNSATEGGALYDADGTMKRSGNSYSDNAGGDCVGSSCVPGDIVTSSLCSMADAITAANTDTATGGCPAGSGADSIGLSADITLDAALPAITSEITILGHDKSIDGAKQFRIFHVTKDGALTVNNLTMKNGNVQEATGSDDNAQWGGAILNYGSLEVNQSKFVDNKAHFGGAIESESGTVDIAGSDFSGNSAKIRGGAIYQEAGGERLTIDNSDFDDNSSQGDGGAILNKSVASVSGSEFKKNSATGDGGAIYNRDGAAQLSVVNNAFSGNTAAQGGDIFNSGTLLERSGNTPPAGGGLDCVGPGCTDGLVVNATCSLADAITAATLDEATGGCPAGEAGADTITMATDVTLAAALPNITSEITIEGDGHTVSGDDQFRIFFVEETGNLSINNMTLTKGNATDSNGDGCGRFYGGAICSEGVLAVTSSILSDNRAGYGGAIYIRGGEATIRDSEFDANTATYRGGAIRNTGVLTQTGNSFTNNSPADGCTNVGGGTGC